MRTFRSVLCGAVLLAVLACKDTLLVPNSNNADRDRALGTAADLETFIGLAAYNTAHNATLAGSNDDLQTQLQVMGLENFSGLANFAMGPRGNVPRGLIDNQPNGTGDAGNLRDFTVGHRAARIASIGLDKLRTVSLGSLAANARAKAFAYFARGVAFGNLALAYDSASILSENDATQDIVALSGYQAVMAAAQKDLDSAIAVTNGNSGSFPLPSTWINGQALTAAAFIQLVHSYKARFLARVARTPAEAAAVNWNTVITEVNAGITGDFIITMSPSAGWDVVWPAQAFATGSASWHQMHQFILGMADVSGGYAAWLALPRSGKAPFVVVTPDLRLPQGATRAAQVGDTLRAGFKGFYVGATANPGRPYIRNRPAGEDAPQDAFGFSMYDYFRTRAFFGATPTRSGPYPIMTISEMRLLAAEAYLRLNNFAAAIPLINASRSDPNRGGLPAIPLTVADTLTDVPGGAAACVPRVPDIAQAFKGTKCGNVWDALKWEYRIETAYAGYGMWYFASRVWGDLPEGTALHWPVPNEEMLTRRKPFYSIGGVGAPSGAAKGNYGLFSGGVY
jgi:hypothetical protein